MTSPFLYWGRASFVLSHDARDVPSLQTWVGRHWDHPSNSCVDSTYVMIKASESFEFSTHGAQNTLARQSVCFAKMRLLWSCNNLAISSQNKTFKRPDKASKVGWRHRFCPWIQSRPQPLAQLTSKPARSALYLWSCNNVAIFLRANCDVITLRSFLCSGENWVKLLYVVFCIKWLHLKPGGQLDINIEKPA